MRQAEAKPWLPELLHVRRDKRLKPFHDTQWVAHINRKAWLRSMVLYIGINKVCYLKMVSFVVPQLLTYAISTRHITCLSDENVDIKHKYYFLREYWWSNTMLKGKVQTSRALWRVQHFENNFGMNCIGSLLWVQITHGKRSIFSAGITNPVGHLNPSEMNCKPHSFISA